MQATSKIIRKRLRKRFPKLLNKRIILHDPIYELPEYATIEQLTRKWALEKLGKLNNAYAEYKGDCDKFSLIYHAFMAEYRMLSEEGDYAWALGEIDMIQVQGLKAVHGIDIFLTDTEIYLVEPQIPSIWLADTKQDIPFMIDC